MKKKQPAKRRTDPWGIDCGYEDAYGEWHDITPETHEAVRRAMGGDPGEEAPVDDASVLFLRPGKPACAVEEGELELESGERIAVERALPGNLPFGYHTLRTGKGKPVRVIVTPDRCWLPGDLKTWGWALQLYALRSKESWGIGDLRDLRRFAEWSSQELGAGMLMINPLHAATPVISLQPSPYYPTSRRYRNPLYIAVDEVPGAEDIAQELEKLRQAGQALNSERLIDRDAVFRLKMEALDKLWMRAGQSNSFEQYLRREGRDLERFATFCAFAEQMGGGWHAWPDEYQQPDGPAVRQFSGKHADRIRFHCWLQWLLDEQLAHSARSLALMQDLPIGVDPGGADAWAAQDLLARGVSVGAPPDKFNTAGQDWGLPPFIPWKLRAAGYEPFIQIIRSTLRHAGGLRIDHVMGLFRLFWVPQGLGPAKGTYVRYNSDELLSIVALESQRARAFVVGEDLGTVEKGVPEKLQQHGILSYRVFWFEEDPPKKYPELALSAISTHDLPTLAGMWTGSDLEAQRRIGLNPNDEETRRSHARIGKLAKVKEDAPIEEVVVKVHRLLAESPSMVLTAQIDDALAVEERPNMPATNSDQWPNWSIALPQTLEEIQENKLVKEVAGVLAQGR